MATAPTIEFHKQATTPDSQTGTERSFTETSLIKLSSPNIPQLLIENHVSYPDIYQPHPQRTEFYCVNLSLDQNLAHPDIRILTATWSTSLGDAFLVDGQPKYDRNPLNRPVRVVWGTYKTTKPVHRVYSRRLPDSVDSEGYNRDSSVGSADIDKKGKIEEPEYAPINTAGELFALQQAIDFRVLSMEKNVARVPEFASKSGCFLNSDKVKIRGITYDKYSLLACDFQISDAKFEFGKVFYVWSWNFYVDDVDFWHQRKRNVGFNEKVTKYYDGDGNEVPAPVPGGKKIDVLHPIVVGPVDKRHYPSQPVLLRPNGKALRAKRKGDPEDPKLWTGEIMTTESKANDDRDQSQKDKDWEESLLKFRTLPAIPFQKNFPLR